jgi:hypothetical protein
LLPVVVTSDGEVLDAEASLRILSLVSPFVRSGVEGLLVPPSPAPSDAGTLARATSPSTPLGTNRDALDDAVEQAVFFAQAGLDAAEHHRFERAAIQGERFVEDRLLVLRKRRASLAERFDLATLRRDGATGSEAREDAERARAGLQRQLDVVEEELERLGRREDPRFQQHQAHIQRRRYAPPRLETLFDLDLVIE